VSKETVEVGISRRRRRKRKTGKGE